jgi:hypothetical protein
MNIIELAREAGFPDWENTDQPDFLKVIERFAHLVRAATLEEAAGVCDEHANASKMVYTGMSAMHCAAAIRQLKETK